ncbi:MAG: TIR domain-containing protein [Oscillospiraceae bacterium]|nr:TIR domain-containing protein [Oscillospiraceae bacterium]
MAMIKCKMCGGDMELSPDRTFGTCEYCGSTMTLPRVSDEQRAARFNRGNHFRRLGEFDKALAIYENIVREDENDAEAHWCCALCRFGIEYVEDPSTYEYVPTCHRASFDSILEDVDYQAALEHSDGVTRRQYQRDAAKIAEVQRGILATVNKEEPFDVFLCYKETDEQTGQRSRDSLDAQEVYYRLTEKGYRVFFARITLEDKAGAEYEPYIFAALQSAKVMIVLGEKPEHFSAVWVKNEWSRYLALMKKDRSRLLIPCYKNMDPYDLPEQLGVLQSYDMAKIGFLQDLIRGVGKVLEADKPKETTPAPAQTVVREVVQSTGGVNLNAQIKRGQIALEDHDWAAADAFFDKALDLDAECAEAYFGKALAAEKCASGEELVQVRLVDSPDYDDEERLIACEADTERIERAAKGCAVPGYFEENTVRLLFDENLRSFSSVTSAWKNRIDQERKFWVDNRLLSRAQRYARGELSDTFQGLQRQVMEELSRKLAESEAEDQRKIEAIRQEYAIFLEQAEQSAKQKHEEYTRLVKQIEAQQLAEAEEREKQIQALHDQKAKLETEFTQLKGVFAGKRKKEIMEEILEIEGRLKYFKAKESLEKRKR